MKLPDNSKNSYMNVIKRNEIKEPVSFDKILRRIEVQCKELNLTRINPFEVTKDTISGLYDGITTEDIDHYAATNCSDKIRDDPQYDKLASALCISRLHKMTSPDFMITTTQLYEAGLVTKEYYDFVVINIESIQSKLNYARDYDFDYFGYKTLEKSYLHKIKLPKSKIIERPQHLLMRVAIALNMNSIEDLLETYECLSGRYFVFGSPTLYNSGSNHQQLASCFLLKMDDNLESILDTIKEVGLISKRAGGIGIGISDIRASGSLIVGTNGLSTGVVPMIQVLNWIGRYINQGGKRNGAIVTFLEPFHADVFAFCELRSNKGNEEERARDIFLGLWIPDLFMKRVESGGVWSLMCPNECPGLTNCYGEEFEELYERYEKEGRYRKQILAKELWFHILAQQIETGMPYMMYKDSVNRRSNQQNLGVIKSSNLCVSPDTYLLTSNGQIKIGELKDKYVNVWNGVEWSNVIVKQTGANVKLMKVILENGKELKCTPEHKFYMKSSGKQIIKDCKDLVIGDELIDYRLPKLKHTPVLHNNNIDISVVPIDKTQDEILSWFGALYQKYNYGQICTNDKEYLMNTQLVLQTCGIDSSIHCDNIKENENSYILCFDVKNLNKLTKYGININIISKSQLSKDNLNIIKSVEYLDGVTDTYCLTEHKKHMAVFNGILTGQCAEIVEYTSSDEISVCTLSSICLPRFIEIEDGKKVFNYKKLQYMAGMVTKNLNNVIDINMYPVEKAKKSNMRNRPLGIGIQGLSDVYCMMGIPYDSMEARIINKKISETIYYGALCMSNELAKKYGPYESFYDNGGCPFSKGILQWHMWGLTEEDLLMGFDWKTLIKDIMEYGTRNSLLTTIMPTASSSQIMGNTESYEAIISNVSTRTTMAGEFTVINKHLVEDLIGLGLWNKEIQNELLYDKGSVQSIAAIPNNIKAIYKTAFELQNKPILIQSIERGPFIDQTQSFNMFCQVPDFDKLSSAHFFGWKGKLKTGMYYLKTQPAIDPISFGLDIDVIREIERKRGIKNGYKVSETKPKQNTIEYGCAGGGCSA